VAIPLLLLVLKLPTGALTAFLGLLLLHGNFVPGLTALDDPGQILAWAVIFGAAQQLVTGLVDKKAQSVLDSTGSAPMEGDKE
jgi:succinate-acetate transporter protein